MAEYLAFIGLNQEHITTIANGGRAIWDELIFNESSRRDVRKNML